LQETEAFVPLSRPFVLCVDQDCPDASDFGSPSDAQDGVAKQRLPQPSSLKGSVDRKSTQEHDRDGVRHVPPDLAGRRREHDGAIGKAVKSYDTSAFANDVGSRSAGAFIAQRPGSQPIVELGETAIEGIEIMSRAKRLRRPQL
jgi:hypothetical protein